MAGARAPNIRREAGESSAQGSRKKAYASRLRARWEKREPAGASPGAEKPPYPSEEEVADWEDLFRGGKPGDP